jgi:hypothetical protein
MANFVKRGTGTYTGTGTGIGSECQPHDPALTAGDACWEFGGLAPGWNLISADCKPNFIPDPPGTAGTWIGERRRTECKRDTGSGSGT